MMKVLSLVLCMLFLSSCASFKAKRTDAKESDEKALEITDNWVSKDTENAIKEILKQMRKHRGFQRYMKRYGAGVPKLFVAEVQNSTSEAYFPIGDLNDEFLTELSMSGDYVLVDAAARDRILDEITYQNDGMVSPDTAKSVGKQIGADLMIFGNIYMKPEKRDGKTVKQYSINIRMTDIEKGIEVLRTRTKVYKYSDKSSYSW
jgi:uncharacterized protein (TIGR02722 family)